MVTRNLFRVEFIKRHGEFKYLEELIRMIEDYQINKYGTTLYEWENSRAKRDVNTYLGAEEIMSKKRGVEKMNNVYINLKDFYGYTIIEIFRNQDLVSVKELIDKCTLDIANNLNVLPEEIIYTSGASESNN